ncbi:MAG: serine hydrolase domain-containing protein [Deltaproteobacteria bacterium]
MTFGFHAANVAALSSQLDRTIEETSFSGVVQVAHAGRILYARAAGFAERAQRVPNTLDTQFAIASGTKALTALALMSLIAEGRLALDTEVHGVLGQQHELVARAVTVRQLLAHTSGMGDYLDESAITDIEDYMLEVPVERLACPADFVPLLAGRPTQFLPGTKFAYCNSGYVLLALLIEVVSGRSYYDVVQERVCAPAGMQATSFLRLDELPGSAAIGYLPKRGWRSNHLHVPVRGAGDGGAYSTAGDVARLWTALFAGRIVPSALVQEMIRPQHDSGPAARRYGLGFWLTSARAAVQLEGSDAGISFRSSFEPTTGLLYSVLSNTTSGAWPVVRQLEALLL